MSQELHNKTVKLGIAISVVITLVLTIGLFAIIPTITQELPLIERVKLGIVCLVFPAVFFLVVITRIGFQRFGNPSEDPTKVVANSEGMEIDLRVLSNTHEQIMIFSINVLALAVLLPYQYLSLLPIYSGLFVTGRIIFWVAYRHNVLWRAPGFAMSMLPAVVGLVYCCVVLVLRVFT